MSQEKEIAISVRNILYLFNLKRYKKVRNIEINLSETYKQGDILKSLIELCNFLSRDYCLYIKSPLWGLKYCEKVEMSSESFKIAIRDIVDNILVLDSENAEISTIVENINKISSLYKYDIRAMLELEKQNLYYQGFINYITNAEEVAPIDKIGLEEILQDIKKKVKKSIYLMSEKEIVMYVCKYRVKYLFPVTE